MYVFFSSVPWGHQDMLTSTVTFLGKNQPRMLPYCNLNCREQQQKRQMGSYSIGEALNLLLEKSKWKPKVNELRLREDWDIIVGKTIAKYTRNINLYNGILTIYTDVGALKQELSLGKEQLKNSINEYLGEIAVFDIVVK